MRGRGWYYKQKYGGGGRGGSQAGAGDSFGGGGFRGGRDRGGGGFRGGASQGRNGDGGSFGSSSGPYEDNDAEIVVQPRSGSLESEFRKIDGASYGAYKGLVGQWSVEEFDIIIDRVQSDPYAPPSHLRVRLSQTHARFPGELCAPKIRNVALCDFVARRFCEAISRTGIDQSMGGSGWSGPKGGDIRMVVPGQHILQRTCILITNEHVEARCTVALPARGRTILGQAAVSLVCHQLLKVARSALYYSSLNSNMLRQHIESVEDQEHLRGQLDSAGLVGFVINGAVLPRRSGVDDRPMTSQQEPNLVYFQSPPSLEVAFKLPNHGTIKGMGLRKGITLIIGGGFHGKTTLLEALEVGIYNKIPGDGREFVTMDPGAVKVRAEDGRVVNNVDISPFINNLPFGKQTTEFYSEDASGSTSQAANILEAVEQGTSTLLIDEDTCATNFMIRDARMQALVAKEKEPITAFLFRVKPLFHERGVSTIMVIGGSGDFFDVADVVLQLDMYQARDVTTQAKEIASSMKDPHQSHAYSIEHFVFRSLRKRLVAPESLINRGKTKSISTRAISYGDTEIDLSGVEQLVEQSQTMAIADCMKSLANSPLFDGKRTLAEIVQAVTSSLAGQTGIGSNGLDALSPYPTGNYSMPRHFELAFAINRLRGLKVRSIAVG